MSRYSYEKCLENSYKVNWKIEDVLDGRRFDASKRWLPRALSGADALDFLDEEERCKLTHIEMASYAHMFMYAEAFVAPMVVDLAHEAGQAEARAFDALANFAAEEVKHMNMFTRLRDEITDQLGFRPRLLDDLEENARFVLAKDRGAVLLLTACIEWFTQRHYRECFQAEDNLDPFTLHVFKCHWLEESQHAQMDHLETLRAFSGMHPRRADRAIDDLIELVATVDTWLVRQSRFDCESFQRYIDRNLSEAEATAVNRAILAAKRHTFLIMGVTHPSFEDLFAEVTTDEQQGRVNEALVDLLPALAA